MLVDNKGNIWLQTYDSPEYLVLNGDGLPLGSFDLSDDLQLSHVDKNRLYAIKAGKNGYEVQVFGYEL